MTTLSGPAQYNALVVAGIAAEGGRIPVIKALRKATGAGLKVSKEAIDGIWWDVVASSYQEHMETQVDPPPNTTEVVDNVLALWRKEGMSTVQIQLVLDKLVKESEQF